MRYSKPFQSPPRQIDILKARGLVVTDEAKARAYLERIGYYRLSGYAYPFRVIAVGPDGDGEPRLGDAFKPGVEFRHIVELYVLDKKLRLAMLDGVERVEIGLRTSIALLMGAQHGPWSHRDPSKLDGKFAKRIDRTTGRTAHEAWLDKLDSAFRRSNEDFARHFKSKYPDDAPPVWMATELWDFGLLSRFYQGMLFGDRKAISRQYGVEDPDVLGTWLRAINDVRNICAHHGRLWNRPLTHQGAFPHGLPALEHIARDSFVQTRLYGAAAAIRFLLLTINPATSWPLQLKAILDRFPDAPGVSVKQTGFPDEWDRLPLWIIPAASE